jgi:hypothetical protein
MDGHSIGSNSKSVVARRRKEFFIQQGPGETHQIHTTIAELRGLV